MKLTQKIIDQIQEAMLHTNLKGEINWKDGDDIEVQIAGTFACLLYTSPSPRDVEESRMPSSA